MTERAQRIANVLLQVGALDDRDPDQRALFEELMGNPVLYEDVRERLAAVGFELIQFLGHLGARLSRDAELAHGRDLRNPLDLHAGHIRVLVYLWIQLVYRQIKATGREEAVEVMPGREQVSLAIDGLDDDEEFSIPIDEVRAEFAEEYSATTLKGLLTTLKRHRFVRQDGASGALFAGPSLYVLVDPLRMEEFAVGLARRDADSRTDGGEGGC